VQNDSLQRKLPIADEASARLHCLRKRVDAPNLAEMRDFIRCHIARSHGKIIDVHTLDSCNTFAGWFFAGFNRIRGTPINEEERTGSGLFLALVPYGVVCCQLPCCPSVVLASPIQVTRCITVLSAEPVARRAIDFSTIHRMRLACDTGARRVRNDNSSSATYRD
jgi:hypothetical protein